VVPISFYACALLSALSLSLRSRFCPTLFDAVLLLFRCSVVKGREREREREREARALLLWGERWGLPSLFCRHRLAWFPFCFLCCVLFLRLVLFATGSSICCSTRLGL
jgi:hypothetical protein